MSSQHLVGSSTSSLGCIEEVEETSGFSRYSALVITSSGLSVVDARCRCKLFRTGSSRRCARLDGDWYVAALPNQGHAGEGGGPQVDGCESEYEHRAAVGTRGDLHLVLEKRMLLIWYGRQR